MFTFVPDGSGGAWGRGVAGWWVSGPRRWFGWLVGSGGAMRGSAGFARDGGGVFWVVVGGRGCGAGLGGVRGRGEVVECGAAACACLRREPAGRAALIGEVAGGERVGDADVAGD